jgi:hypothetical protein
MILEACDERHYKWYEISSITVFPSKTMHKWKALRTSPLQLSIWPLHKYFSHPSSVFVFFPTPAIKLKLKLGLQIGGRLLMATHVDGSNYLVNEQQVLGFVVLPFTSLHLQNSNLFWESLKSSVTLQWGWKIFLLWSLKSSSCEKANCHIAVQQSALEPWYGS